MVEPPERNRRATSSPLSSGIRMSRITTSGRCSIASANACPPDSASATTSISPASVQKIADAAPDDTMIVGQYDTNWGPDSHLFLDLPTGQAQIIRDVVDVGYTPFGGFYGAAAPAIIDKAILSLRCCWQRHWQPVRVATSVLDMNYQRRMSYEYYPDCG